MDAGVILFVEIIGSIAMGIFVAWIAFFFLNREKIFTANEFGEFVAIFFGGTIIQVYSSQVIAAENAWVFWLYSIGLVVGMLAYKYVGGGNIKLVPVPREPDTEHVTETVTEHVIKTVTKTEK
jgi:hypothetical protein